MHKIWQPWGGLFVTDQVDVRIDPLQPRIVDVLAMDLYGDSTEQANVYPLSFANRNET